MTVSTLMMRPTNNDGARCKFVSYNYIGLIHNMINFTNAQDTSDTSGTVFEIVVQMCTVGLGRRVVSRRPPCTTHGLGRRVVGRRPLCTIQGLGRRVVSRRPLCTIHGLGRRVVSRRPLCTIHIVLILLLLSNLLNSYSNHLSLLPTGWINFYQLPSN